MKTDREALEAIRDYPVSTTSTGGLRDWVKPDVLAAAIEDMQAIAAAQLEGEDWRYGPQDKPRKK